MGNGWFQLNGGCWSWVGPVTAAKFNEGKECLEANFASIAPNLVEKDKVSLKEV